MIVSVDFYHLIAIANLTVTLKKKSYGNFLRPCLPLFCRIHGESTWKFAFPSFHCILQSEKWEIIGTFSAYVKMYDPLL